MPSTATRPSRNKLPSSPISVPELISKLQIRTRRCAARTRLAISESISKPQPGENMTRT